MAKVYSWRVTKAKNNICVSFWPVWGVICLLKFLSGKPHDFPETLHTRGEICSFPFKFVTCEMLFEVYVTRDRDETRSNHSYHSHYAEGFCCQHHGGDWGQGIDIKKFNRIIEFLMLKLWTFTPFLRKAIGFVIFHFKKYKKTRYPLRLLNEYISPFTVKSTVDWEQVK